VFKFLHSIILFQFTGIKKIKLNIRNKEVESENIELVQENITNFTNTPSESSTKTTPKSNHTNTNTTNFNYGNLDEEHNPRHYVMHQPAPVDPNVETVVRVPKKEKEKKFIRKAAGTTWEDISLSEFPENDYRIFVANLGNEVTDEWLKKSFSKYPSFAKAKVIRDHRTTKTRGFGFVSFLDSDDFIRALREMNGKYIGNRPCRLTKSRWEDRSLGKR